MNNINSITLLFKHEVYCHNSYIYGFIYEHTYTC